MSVPSIGSGLSAARFRAAPGVALSLAALLAALAGCGSDSSSSPTVPAAPTVSLVAPGDGATLLGMVDLVATAENSDRVDFICDDDLVGTVTASPYLVQWDSQSVADGSHRIRARATGGGGEASDERSIFVANGDVEITITIQPDVVHLEVGATQQFTATVTGTADDRVSWSVDEGASAGSITPDGLYTAPALLPTPPRATVRATSPASSGTTAIAEVVLSDGGGGTPDVASLAALAFDSTADIGNLGDEAISTVAEAVWGASELAGTPTFVGTLTQSQTDPDVWTYSPTPTDRLRIVYASAPVAEIVIRTFEGYTDGTWEDFLRAHDLDFDFEIQGGVVARVRSETRGAGDRTWQWTRYLNGSLAVDGASLSIDLTYTGRERAIVEATGSEFELTRAFTGTAGTAAFQMNVDQSSWTSIVHANDAHVRDSQIWSNSSVTIEGVTYAFDQAHVAWSAGTAFNDPGLFNVVVSVDYWEAQGTFRKNGAALGSVRFDGPVLANTHGPDLILDLGGEQEVFLHTLIDF